MNEVKQLNIKNAEAYRLASKLSTMTGQSITSAVIAALEEKIAREARRSEREGLAERLMKIAREYQKLPASGLTEDEILGYDERGLPR